MNRFAQAYKHLRAVEKKYGSIINTPHIDPDYLAIRAIYPVGNGRGRRTDDEIDERIEQYIIKGYPASYVSNRVGVSVGRVYRIIRERNLKPKRMFKFRIEDLFGRTYYTDSLIHFVKVFFNAEVPSKNAKEYLMRRSFNVKQSSFSWHAIPNGSHFLLYYMDHSTTKDGDSSYIFPDSITNS